MKAECLRLLATLKLEARMQLILGFVDTYLRLDVTEKQVFQSAISTMGLDQQQFLKFSSYIRINRPLIGKTTVRTETKFH